MKKFIVLLLGFIITFGHPSYLDTNYPISVIVNHDILVFDVNPTVIEGRTVVPVGVIFNALGFEVDWDESTRTVTGSNKSVIIKLQLDQTRATVNGKPVVLDVPATVISGRTMVPVKFVAEATGALVEWNNNTRTITINSMTAYDVNSEMTDYRPITVDGGDLSGDREANVVVDIGFGDRKYYSYTNEYGQVIKVTAEEIIPQDESIEPILSNGRYYADEANVPGVESPTLDKGHIIADSLGGVSNAYNITPQNSALNQHGDQAYMEKVIREAGGCTDFIAVITYPNVLTQVPSHYSFTFTLNGDVIHESFDNVSPDEINHSLQENQSLVENQSNDMTSNLVILSVGLISEEVIIKNISTNTVQLKGYKLISITGNQVYTFSDYLLAAGKTVTVYSGKGSGDLKWTGSYIWNNNGDSAALYDASGKLLDER